MAFGGDFNQLFGNVADFLLNPGLFGLPCQPAQRIKLNVVVFHAVARNDVDILNRHEQFGITGIQNFQAIMRRTARGNVFQSQKPADTVFNVYDQFADRQGRNIGNKVFGSNFFGTLAVLPLAENILFRNQAQAVAAEAVRQVHNQQDDFLMRGFFQGIVPIIGKAHILNAVFAHQRKQAFARTGGIAADDARQFGIFGQIILKFGINLRGIDVSGMRKTAAGNNAGVYNPFASGKTHGRKPECPAGLNLSRKFARGQKHQLRLDRAISVDFAGRLYAQRLLPGQIIVHYAVFLGQQSIVDAAVKHDMGGRQIIEQALHRKTAASFPCPYICARRESPHKARRFARRHRKPRDKRHGNS